jgi:hypothetical protein
MTDITHTDQLLWLGSMLTASVLPVAAIVAMLIYGPDVAMFGFLLFSSIAVLGIWQRSSAGSAFLVILLVIEGFYLVTAGLSTFGLSALSGQGFGAFDRIVAILVVAIVLTAVALGLFTTFLNRRRQRATQTFR